MCRQPGCRCFCTCLLTVSPSCDKFAAKDWFMCLSARLDNALPFQIGPNRVNQPWHVSIDADRASVWQLHNNLSAKSCTVDSRWDNTSVRNSLHVFTVYSKYGHVRALSAPAASHCSRSSDGRFGLLTFLPSCPVSLQNPSCNFEDGLSRQEARARQQLDRPGDSGAAPAVVGRVGPDRTGELAAQPARVRPHSPHPAGEGHLPHRRPVQGEDQEDEAGVPSHQGQLQDEVLEVLRRDGQGAGEPTGYHLLLPGRSCHSSTGVSEPGWVRAVRAGGPSRLVWSSVRRGVSVWSASKSGRAAGY